MDHIGNENWTKVKFLVECQAQKSGSKPSFRAYKLTRGVNDPKIKMDQS